MLIEVDKYKEKIKDYDPARSEDFHLESGKLADRDFIENLKTKSYKKVVLMAGGSASGKTEYASEYLTNKTFLIYDGTLKNFDGFKTKLDKINRYDKSIKNIKIILIIPKDWRRSLSAFLGRERKMSPLVFFETQIKSKLTVSKILLETKSKVEIYFSDYEESKNKLVYIRLSMKKGRKQSAVFLKDLAERYREIAVGNGFDIK